MDPRPGPPPRTVIGSADAAPVLAPARIRYQDDQPYSLDFGDIYHAADGAAEVLRVFVGPCRLPELASERAAQVIRIGEFGFGSGLNFVLAAEACLAAGARLHFVSCEAHPLHERDLTAIADRRTLAHPLYRELAALYPPRIGGWHRRSLAGGRVHLSLWLGAAAEALADLHGRQRQPMDAWFLDGFAPDRNPELWQQPLFQAMAGLSRRGTRVATFTAAGRVRRGLEAAGFRMSRIDQRPHKRETLAGTFEAVGLDGFTPAAEVVVVGGGLAGASAARHLAEAGTAVELWDDPEPAQPPASRMPATVLHARLLGDASTMAALRCHAYLYAAAWLHGRPGFDHTGALQVAGDALPAQRLQALANHYAAAGAWVEWLAPDAAAALAGWPLAAGGLHFPHAGTVALPTLVRSLLEHPRIHRQRARCDSLPPDRIVILAAGAAVRGFADAAYLEVVPVQGQLDIVDVAAPPAVPLVGGRYLVPCAGALVAGSTYEHRPWDPQRATRHNLQQLQDVPHTWRERHRGTRSVSSDRAPVAGPLYSADGALVPARFVSTGHGSAGNVSAPLAGALLSDWIHGDCPPLARAVEAVLSPWRFRERQARRGARHGVPR